MIGKLMTRLKNKHLDLHKISDDRNTIDDNRENVYNESKEYDDICYWCYLNYSHHPSRRLSNHLHQIICFHCRTP